MNQYRCQECQSNQMGRSIEQTRADNRSGVASWREHRISRPLLAVIFGAALIAALSFQNPGVSFAQNAPATVSVDAAANRHSINPNVYGTAYGSTAALLDLNIPLNRSGGDPTSRYNWNINADNRAFDFYFESIAYNSSTPGELGDTFISNSKSANAQAMLTIPMIGWVAKLGANRTTLASFSQAKYGAQTGNDPFFTDAGNGVLTSTGQYVTGNDPNDANVPADSTFQNGWIQHLVQTWGEAANGGLKYYLMDNEPSIWHSSHRDVHPTGATMAEIRDKILDYGGKVKANDPTALVVGPEEWGWSGYFYSGYDQQYGNLHGWANLPDRGANGNWDYLPWLLDQLRQNNSTTGKRILDVFSVHYYPQGGEFGNDVTTATELMRNRSTRSLWDPTYVDQSWINSRVGLIPRLKNWVATYYPGTQIGLTEYNWGAESSMNGATAQADILGILGREGLDLATRWTTPANNTPTYQAMKIYRNYDGNKSAFGDVSVSTSVPDANTVSAFGAQRASDGALTVMVISKYLTGITPVTLNIANFGSASAAQTWQVTSSAGINHLTDTPISSGSLSYNAPAQSITLFVIPTSAASAPATPAGLTAVANNSVVALNWNAVTGAISYSVKRSSASGGPYTTIGSAVTNSFSDTSVVNGNTYYYVVSAVNSSGESANSTEVTAAPQAITPAAPTGLSAAAGNGQVTLNWNTSVGAASYTVQRSTTSGSGYVPIASPVSTSYIDTAVTNGTTYYYVVSAGNSVGTGPNSGQASATPAYASPTFTASAILPTSSVTAGAVTPITITVTDTSGYLSNALVDLEIFNSSGGRVGQQTWPGLNFQSVQSQNYTWNWTAAAISDTYVVKIGVFDSGWTTNYYWLNFAGNITVTGGTVLPTFSSSGGFTPSTAAQGAAVSVGASLTDTGGPLTNGVVDLEVYDSTNTRVGQQSWSGQSFTANQQQSYTWNWKAPNAAGTYTLRIGVFDSTWATGYHWNSNAATLTVTSGQAPATPAGVTAIPGDSHVTLSWSAVPGAASYNIKRSTTSGSGYMTVSNPSATTSIDTGLTNGTTYYYVVSALNASGESPNSGQVQATPTTLPVIASFNPASGAISTTVTLNGDNFNGATSVKFNGLGANYSLNSATQITAFVPLGATSGPISVTNASGTGTSAINFTVPAPSGITFTPTAGSLGSMVSISGSGFTGATSVKFNGADSSFAVNSDTSITDFVPYSATTGPISVTTPAGTGTSATNFTVNAPAITSFNPNNGSVNSTVNITGSAFTAASAVKFNGISCNYVLNSDTSITATVPFGATTGPISVTSPAGTGTSAANFTVNPPSITNFSPTSGPIGSFVTLTGSSFTGVTAVKFGSISANFFYSSDTQINATVPPGFVSGLISVITPAGTGDTSALTPANFTVPGPVITNLNPNNGSLRSTVVINGSGFTSASGVKFNGVSANYYINLDSQIVAFVPDTATTGPVTVTTPSGTSAGVTFTVNPPVITGSNPTHGSIGSFVTISGSGFTLASGVKFGGVSASFFVSTDTSISAQVPSGFVSGTISVTGPIGTGTSAGTFTVDAPIITSFSPTSGPVGTNVVVNGSGFTGATSIQFNGISASLFVSNDGQINTTVPVGATTGPITVTGPGGTGTSATNFVVQ